LRNCIEQAISGENSIGNINFEDEVLIDNELRGVKINAAQAVSIVQILGIEIIRQ
jgi:hypothetical protein